MLGFESETLSCFIIPSSGIMVEMMKSDKEGKIDPDHETTRRCIDQESVLIILPSGGFEVPKAWSSGGPLSQILIEERRSPVYVPRIGPSRSCGPLFDGGAS